MTSKEALEILKSCGTNTVEPYESKILEALEQLVERDTPMTPIYESIELICPKCREEQHTNIAKFCSECGQRLVWEELENE